MYRGTTPTFELKITDQDIDLTEADHVYVTFRTKKGKTTYTGNQLEVTAHEVDVYLSQEETLAFPLGTADVQINWTYDDGKRACTNIARIVISENLLEVVLP